ncbi:MAG: hypothetical protein US89_C0002G0132 [Candidatus Peregrinibacteria bacterium GW2011_GWF2_38_29]|nr:MAG: hypothetical protein US89_C0002G0132 [Candidatus Peregrinibacteria bacterium GW2011_GWF2_38_29]HBB02287.1 hypothetical protein [Candidatus Peregrinibacteria bacterium]
MSRSDIDIPALVEAVKNLPKVDAIDVNDHDYGPYFGNNFYLLFLILLFPEKYGYDRYCIREAKKRWGEKWNNFTVDNKDLFVNLKSALADFEIYKELTILRIEDRVMFESIVRDFGPLGMCAIEVPIVKKMNVILREVFDKMRVAGMDPEYFCTPGTY